MNRCITGALVVGGGHVDEVMGSYATIDEKRVERLSALRKQSPCLCYRLTWRNQLALWIVLVETHNQP